MFEILALLALGTLLFLIFGALALAFKLIFKVAIVLPLKLVGLVLGAVGTVLGLVVVLPLVVVAVPTVLVVGLVLLPLLLLGLMLWAGFQMLACLV